MNSFCLDGCKEAWDFIFCCCAKLERMCNDSLRKLGVYSTSDGRKENIWCSRRIEQMGWKGRKWNHLNCSRYKNTISTTWGDTKQDVNIGLPEWNTLTFLNKMQKLVSHWRKKTGKHMQESAQESERYGKRKNEKRNVKKMKVF